MRATRSNDRTESAGWTAARHDAEALRRAYEPPTLGEGRKPEPPSQREKMLRLSIRAFACEKGNDDTKHQHGNGVLHEVHNPEARWVSYCR